MTYELNTHGTHLVPSLDTNIQALASNERAEEAAGEGITSTIGINDFFAGNGRDLEDLGSVRLRRSHHNSGLGAVRENHYTRARRVRLGGNRNGPGNRWKVRRVWKASSGCVCLSLGLVCNDDIAVREDGVQLGGEELWDERRRQVQCERFAVLGRFCAELEHGSRTVREEEALYVEDFCSIHQRSYSGGRQVRYIELLGCPEGRDEGAEKPPIEYDAHRRSDVSLTDRVL